MRDNYTHKEKEEYEYIKKEVLNEPTVYDNTERALLIDADSLLYLANYGCEENIEDAKDKLFNLYQGIVNNIEKWFNIISIKCFVGGKSNFRKKIFPKYKDGRSEKHPNINILKQYAIDELEWMESNECEAEDYLAYIWQIDPEKCIIAHIDKDLNQLYGYRYNYNYNSFSYISKEEADYNLAIQTLIGDSTDFKGLSPGIGEKYAKKHLSVGMTKYQYIKNIYLGYLKAWKNNRTLAKENMRLCYKLVKLGKQ